MSEGESMKRLAALTGGSLLMGIAILIGFRAIRSDVEAIHDQGNRFRRLEERIERSMPKGSPVQASPQMPSPVEQAVLVEIRAGRDDTEFVVSVEGREFTLPLGEGPKREEVRKALIEAVALEARSRGAVRVELRTLDGSQGPASAGEQRAALLAIDAAMTAGLKDIVMTRRPRPTPQPEVDGDAMR